MHFKLKKIHREIKRKRKKWAERVVVVKIGKKVFKTKKLCENLIFPAKERKEC